MSSSTAGWIALVAGNDSLTYLMERYTERSGLGIHVVADPPPANTIAERSPVVVWFPSLESLARWRALTRESPGRESPDNASPGHDPAVVVCTSVADERRARELEADYCVLLPLTYDDFRAAVTAVGLPV